MVSYEKLKDLHVFERKGSWFALDTISGALLLLDEDFSDIISLSASGYDKETIAQRLGCSIQEIETKLGELNNTLNEYNLRQSFVHTKASLQTLMLLVAQDCNMRCRYCYADGGNYNQNSPAIMDLDTAISTLDLAHKVGIQYVQFFGGEPLLAFDLIKKLISYCKKSHYHFKFGLMSNGTCVNPEIADFCAQHNISVTISVDGPKDVHDLCRIYPDGSGTFDHVIEGINLLNQKRVSLSLQPVYSKRYIPLASMKDILSSLLPYCKSYILGHVTPMGNTYSSEDIMSEEEVIECFTEAVDYVFDSNENGTPFIVIDIYNVINQLYSNKRMIREHICESLASRLTVFSNGDIFLCQFSNQPENCLGNVHDMDLATLFERRQEVLKKFSIDRLKMWSKNLNGVCISNLEIDKDGFYKPRYPKAYDEYYEHTLYRIAMTDIDKLLETWRNYIGA